MHPPTAIPIDKQDWSVPARNLERTAADGAKAKGPQVLSHQTARKKNTIKSIKFKMAGYNTGHTHPMNTGHSFSLIPGAAINRIGKRRASWR